MPAPPLVEPPACSCSIADMISALLDARGRRQDQPRGARVDDDRDPVVLAELLDQSLQPPLDQRQLVRLVHRAGDVDQEDEVAGRPPRLVDRLGGDADPGQPVLGVPGAAGDLDVDGERIVARSGGGAS